MKPLPTRPEADSLIVGTLREHGWAPHDFKPEGERAYYVKLDTARGERIVWGDATLERAFARSKTQPQLGEPVGIRENGKDPTRVTTGYRNANGHLTSTVTVQKPRPHWVVERKGYFDERKFMAKTLRDARVPQRQAIQNHPALLGAYFVLAGAQEEAAARYANPRQQQHAVEFVRAALARVAELGYELPRVNAKDLKLLAPREPTRREREAPERS